MLGRRSVAVTVGVVGTLALVAAPGALGGPAVTPPASTPNMALMVLQASDLAPGASIGAQRYVAPPKGFSAEYASSLNNPTTTGGTKYFSIDDAVALGSSAINASNLEALDQTVFSTPSGRRGFVKEFIKGAGKKAHLKSKNFKFAPVAAADTGGSSYIEIVTISRKGKSFQEGFADFADGDYWGSFVFVATTIPQSDVVALAQTVDAHVHAVLGTGTTGASGTS